MFTFINQFHLKPHRLGTGLLLLIGILLTGCGSGGGNPEGRTGAFRPESIAITPVPATIAKGKLLSLIVTGTFPDKSTTIVSNSDIVWKSSMTNIATVDTSGVVKGVNEGSSEITAEAYGGLRIATVPVSVTPAYYRADHQHKHGFSP